MMLIDRIKRHEGCSLKPYKCKLGFLTIGYGHKMTGADCDSYKDGITQEKAESLLVRDLALASVQAKVISGENWKNLNEARQGVIVEMVFQLGMGGVLKFGRMWAALDAKDYAKASAEMLDSKWRMQTYSRCTELAEIMEKGVV